MAGEPATPPAGRVTGHARTRTPTGGGEAWHRQLTADPEWSTISTTRSRRWRNSRIQPASGAALLRAARHVLPRSRRRRRRDDGAGVPGHDQSHGRGRRAGSDGDGDHHVHGQGVRRPSESGRQHRVLAAGRLPVASCSRLHRRPARRGGARLPVPAGRDRCLRDVRLELSGVGILGRGRVPDGGRPDARPRQRHPRHGLGRSEHRHLRRDRRRRLYRARGTVGEPDLGRLDESGPHLRPDLVGTDFTSYWVYVAGPLVGASSPSGRPGFSGARAAAVPSKRQQRAFSRKRPSNWMRSTRMPGTRPQSDARGTRPRRPALLLARSCERATAGREERDHNGQDRGRGALAHGRCRSRRDDSHASGASSHATGAAMVARERRRCIAPGTHRHRPGQDQSSVDRASGALSPSSSRCSSPRRCGEP